MSSRVCTLEPIGVADWVSSIVTLLKPNKASVTICGDFKQLVSTLYKYPIPIIEDLFSGGTVFSKLDHNQGYQQLSLSADSKHYLSINTHKGLFWHTRLSYGINSAPGIVQCAMENLIKSIPKVVMNCIQILVQSICNCLIKYLTTLIKQVLDLRNEFLVSSVTYLGHK